MPPAETVHKFLGLGLYVISQSSDELASFLRWGTSKQLPIFQPAGVTSRPDTSKDTLDELALLPGASSPATPLRYDDIIQLIDVQRPYYALFDMAQLGNSAVPTVRGYFLKESESHEENKDPISGSELGRHGAIMGSVACALANPVKDKHYYLAFGAKSVRIEGEGETICLVMSF